jgi:hypothetical protein
MNNDDLGTAALEEMDTVDNQATHTAESSTVPSTEKKPWTDCPGEVKWRILSLLGRADLKTCRLVDRQTGDEATRLLFADVHISPSWNSLVSVSYPSVVHRGPLIALNRGPISLRD